MESLEFGSPRGGPPSYVLCKDSNVGLKSLKSA